MVSTVFIFKGTSQQLRTLPFATVRNPVGRNHLHWVLDKLMTWMWTQVGTHEHTITEVQNWAPFKSTDLSDFSPSKWQFWRDPLCGQPHANGNITYKTVTKQTMGVNCFHAITNIARLQYSLIKHDQCEFTMGKTKSSMWKTHGYLRVSIHPTSIVAF